MSPFLATHFWQAAGRGQKAGGRRQEAVGSGQWAKGRGRNDLAVWRLRRGRARAEPH